MRDMWAAIEDRTREEAGGWSEVAQSAVMRAGRLPSAVMLCVCRL
jgi:hypothetical protein